MITAALLGNPNVGKTSLFNALTGSNQYVGNWAGVTVEKKEGFIHDKVKIVDLLVYMQWIPIQMRKKCQKSF